MKRLNGYKMRLMFIGVVAAIVLGSGSTKADFTFGEPTNLGQQVNSSAVETDPTISADGLTLYFQSLRQGGQGGADIWMTTKQTSERIPEGYWGIPINLGPNINTSYDDFGPEISADGLELYFCSDRPGGLGNMDLYVSRRSSTEDAWGSPFNLGHVVNSASNEINPSISEDGLSLFFSDWTYALRSGGHGRGDIWVTTRETKGNPWSTPTNLGSVVNSSHGDYSPELSPEGRVLFFDSLRPGGAGQGDLWFTRRGSHLSDWELPVNLGILVNDPSGDGNPEISSDGSTLYFNSERPGGNGSADIWQASIIPIVDFNGDRIVDAEDMCIMVDHWGTDNSLCDIGPMPWGDGIVDVEDLIVLAEHLFEQLPGRPIEP